MDMGTFQDLSENKFNYGRQCVTSCFSRGASITPFGDAIVVRNVKKSYGFGKPVLNGLDMTVPCGSIYGLLGSSGCGKTTLLSCIVGIRKVDEGEIRIFGELAGNAKNVGVPGQNVGYMPQEISLYNEFSIGETFNYFGTLSGMTKQEIYDAGRYFRRFLNLPKFSRQVGQLSGGQQRRVSLVAAMLSGPELLILDEPTVGVDPLIIRNIWSHFMELVNTKRTTIIITTHYIEECRNADNIGIIRDGVLLEERPPQVLFNQFHTNNLENIVLALVKMKKDGVNKQNTEESFFNDFRRESSESDVKWQVPYAQVMNPPKKLDLQDILTRIRAMTWKNKVLLLRNPLLTFFVVFIAAFFMSLGCITQGVIPKDLKIGLVNEELNSNHSDCLTIVSKQVVGECHPEFLSCQYLNHLMPGIISLEVYKSINEAVAATREGKLLGYFYFPKDFSQALQERVYVTDSDDDFNFDNSRIILKLDESNKQIAITVKITALEAFKDFLLETASICGFNVEKVKSPLNYLKPIYGQSNTDFRDFLAPSVTTATMFFFPMMSTSIRFLNEKNSGTLYRSTVSGVAGWEVMAAYSICELFLLFFESAINWIVIHHVFQIQIYGSHLLFILIFVLTGSAGVCSGFLFGSICTEEIQAAMFCIAAFMPNLFLSGILWPVEGMVPILQYISPVLPCTLAAEAARSIATRGWPFWHPSVWPGFAVLSFYTFGIFFVSILFHLLKK